MRKGLQASRLTKKLWKSKSGAITLIKKRSRERITENNKKHKKLEIGFLKGGKALIIKRQKNSADVSEKWGI